MEVFVQCEIRQTKRIKQKKAREMSTGCFVCSKTVQKITFESSLSDLFMKFGIAKTKIRGKSTWIL